MSGPEPPAGLRAYLTTNRDFLAPSVRQAIASLQLPTGASVLDAGTGAGGAIPELAAAVGTAGRVLAVDIDPAVVALAIGHAVDTGVADRAVVRAADLIDVLAQAAATPRHAFDAIWASDVVWPGNFDDPADVVRRMAGALRPGGILALFTSNYYQSAFLPGRSRLERAVRTASELRWGLPHDGPKHYDRHLTWLLAAGLAEVSLAAFARVGFPMDADPNARAYLESTVWPEMLESAATSGSEAGLSTEELTDLRELLTPGSERYVLDEPGYFVLHPTLLATGRRPRAQA